MTIRASIKRFFNAMLNLRHFELSNIDFNQIDVWVRRGLISSAALFGILQYVYPQIELLHAIFIVSMAGIVGYFTNYMAIKMLFQPKQGQVLGWRGLVPKNKEQIARSLAESVQTQLLSPDIILDYIKQNDLITKGIDGLTVWLDDNLQNPTVRKAITERVVDILKSQGPELVSKAFDLSEDSLKKLAERPAVMEQVWQWARDSLVSHLNDTENRKQLAVLLRRLFLTELPELAHALDDALEEYLKRKHAVGTLGLSVKRIASFNEAAIEDLLLRFVSDPDTLDQLMGMMDVAIERLRTKLESDETRQLVLDNVEAWITWSTDKARDGLLPDIITRLEAFLDEKDNWQYIDRFCIDSMTWGKNRLLGFVQSDSGQRYFKQQISALIHKLNVTHLVEKQVMGLDTDELEKLILDNTGGNLVAIQVLGGALGVIAGLVQVHIAFALPVAGLIGIVWIGAWRNRRRFQ
ncbi:MAG: DUF445 domain-containing protein [Pseudomonadales bacterium]|uniref:DUF445 domain-containing protein n=1 Tax=Oleiphilus messinensis TaxID=141451 RepID=A0A1Y0IFV0_9GAMM|nr:DUF445 family protein [Oleiphilus messinensis]ARU58254.1 hypothetical protein OLMES_4238 [Oleiphilus messinensis]MCG8609155.1 DUF445 domain-containing protein [Pseudomonadales bacterium]